MVDLLLKNGLIIDPAQGMHTQGSVAVKDGLIASVGDAAAADEPAMVYDLEGKIVVPGLIDIHCNIEKPDVVIVLDDTLLEVVDVVEGIVDDGVVILNTCTPPEQAKKA